MASLVLRVSALAISSYYANEIDNEINSNAPNNKIDDVLKKYAIFFQISNYLNCTSFLLEGKKIYHITTFGSFIIGTFPLIPSSLFALAIYGLTSFVKNKYFIDKEIKEINKEIPSLEQSDSDHSMFAKVSAISTICISIFSLYMNRSFSSIFILNSLLNIKIIHYLYKQKYIKISENFERIINWGNPGYYNLFNWYDNAKLEKFEASAFLKLYNKNNSKQEECSICYETGKEKYYFCTKHIFDLGCLLKHYLSKLKYIDFYNFTKTTVVNQYRTKLRDKYSLTLDKTSLPKCPICVQNYHNSEHSIKYFEHGYNPEPVLIR